MGDGEGDEGSCAGVAGRKILRMGMRVKVRRVVSKPWAVRWDWSCCGRPEAWISSDVEDGSVTQQSMSEFAIVKVLAKLPNSSTFAANAPVNNFP